MTATGILLDAFEAALTPAPSPVAQSEAILQLADESPEPRSREGRIFVSHAREYLLGELRVHDELLNGRRTWQDFDADLLFFGGDPQDEAVAIQADRCLEAAKALLSRLREYQGREELAAFVSGTEDKGE